MRFLLLVAALFVTPSAATAQQNCYVLQNESSTTISLAFKYNLPSAPGSNTIVKLDLQPKGRYPVQGDWCFNPGLIATVTYVLPNNVEQSWSGPLTIGNGVGVLPGQTLRFRNKSGPGADGCLANSYPGSSLYCLKEKAKQGTIACGSGHSGKVGTWPYVELKLTCNNGRKWTITCTDTGEKCNINSHEYCYGLSQWNVGQHCTEPLGNPGLPNGHNK